MIFKKLKLKNFMSYSDAEIDFSGLHTACLSGPNGAGKSSLLDAITWSLWEEGRARTDDLIKLGTNEMSCELEFFMEDELFRVYRSRNKNLRNLQGKSNLEFQIFNQKENSWVSVSRSSVRQTQELIVDTLKMDYEAFVNSVYLKQGKADEFTTKRPSERKQILSDILGLQIYDKLSELASKKVRDIEQKIYLDQNTIYDLRNKIQKKDELETKNKNLKEEIKGEEVIIGKLRDNVLEADKKLNEQKHIQKHIETLLNSKQNQENLIKTLDRQLTGLKEKQEECKKLIAHKVNIELEYSNYNELKKQIEEYEIKKESYTKLVNEKNSLEYKLKDEVRHAEKELAVYKAKINDRDDLKNRLVTKLKEESRFYSDFLPEAESIVSKFQELQDLLVNIEIAGQELKNQKEILNSEMNILNNKEKEIFEKVTILKSHNHELPCPLCKGLVKDKEGVIKAYNDELNACREKKRLLNKQTSDKEKEMEEKRKEYLKIKNEVKLFGRNNLVSYLAQLESIKQEKFDSTAILESEGTKAISYFQSQLEVSKNEFQRIKQQITVLDKELQEFNGEFVSLKKLLDSGNLVKEISTRLSAIEKELKDITYDETKHLTLKTGMKDKEAIQATYTSLIQSEKEISIVDSNIAELIQNIGSANNEATRIEKQINECKSQIGNVQFLEEELSKLKSEEAKKTVVYEETKKEFIVNEQELKDVEKSEEILKEKESNIGEALKDKECLEKLERAFSKNGIPIAIIETVVPELEKEANEILNRLTDNRMHVALRTQKEKKSSDGLIETLDVIIADSAGTRNYELYSGGEAFKIDFALRLALSRLLANRAGSRLQTLVIDEGFGSQDTEGRERLVEVIKSIENEFELMLIVTHLDELKESFPTQIQVYKDEEGSHVDLLV